MLKYGDSMHRTVAMPQILVPVKREVLITRSTSDLVRYGSAARSIKMSGKSACCSTLWGYTLSTVSTLLEYDTAKIVHIHNKKVGIMNRLVQLVIVGYIVG